MFLRRQIFLLSSKQFVGQKLLLYILKADPVDRIRKTFSCDSLLPEQKNRFFHDIEYFFFTRKDFVKRMSVGLLLPQRPPM